MRAVVVVALVLAALAAVALADETNADQQPRRLIELQRDVRVWMTEAEVLSLITKNIGFIDVTDHPDLGTTLKARQQRIAIPTAPTQQARVNTLIQTLDIDNVEDNLNTFTSFNNRYYTSTSGEQSSNWLFQMVKSYAANRTDVSVTQVTHSWLQKSVRARIQGTSSRRDIVVIGAHQDSVNSLSPVNGRAPGADDDGSGSMTILEIFANLMRTGFRPELTVEFQWYSAEEVGLRGSADIVADLVADGIEVRAMMQIDMDGYDAKAKEIAIITDYTDATLNSFVKQLVDEYCTIPWVTSVCGYGCSDHASFNRVGFPSCFPFEQQFNNINPYIHTANDDLRYVSFEHIAEWLRLGTGFVVELSTNN